IDYFMTRKPSIPRRNIINWHYVRDDVLFSTIKVTKGREESEGDKTDESNDGSDDGSNDDNDETVKAGSDKDDDDNDDEEKLAKNDDEDTESDSHVTLTPVHPDGPQESSSVSSFVTIMLNPISDAGVESIFTMASSSIVSLQT
nr:hypothetical protein [Tanacetum cinerariifolium]